MAVFGTFFRLRSYSCNISVVSWSFCTKFGDVFAYVLRNVSTSEFDILLTIYIGFCLIIADKEFWVNVRLFASQYLCCLVDFLDQTWGWSLLCVSDHFNFQLLQFLCVILGILVDSALLCDCFGSALPFFVISLLFLVVFSPNLEIHLLT